MTLIELFLMQYILSKLLCLLLSLNFTLNFMKVPSCLFQRAKICNCCLCKTNGGILNSFTQNAPRVCYYYQTCFDENMTLILYQSV